jgi:hypothetical protein
MRRRSSSIARSAVMAAPGGPSSCCCCLAGSPPGRPCCRSSRRTPSSAGCLLCNCCSCCCWLPPGSSPALDATQPGGSRPAAAAADPAIPEVTSATPRARAIASKLCGAVKVRLAVRASRYPPGSGASAGGSSRQGPATPPAAEVPGAGAHTAWLVAAPPPLRASGRCCWFCGSWRLASMARSSLSGGVWANPQASGSTAQAGGAPGAKAASAPGGSAAASEAAAARSAPSGNLPPSDMAAGRGMSSGRHWAAGDV